tara:strand:+ start:11818 stop:11928 length:111 start_codon:yes stop_codon:yes gene_type:complete
MIKKLLINKTLQHNENSGKWFVALVEFIHEFITNAK